MKRSLSVLIAATPLLLAAPTASAQVPPPTLTGETLSSLGPETTSTSFNCDPQGTSTFTYQTSGVAAGPYPGTYSETGTVTLGPQVLPGGPPILFLISWTASFTITSTAGTVTGTKTLSPLVPPQSPPAIGACTTGGQTFGAQRSANTFNSAQRLVYTATIALPGGEQFADSGTSDASMNDVPATPQTNNFLENYTSEQVTTTPLCDEDSQLDQNQVNNDQGCANP